MLTKASDDAIEIRAFLQANVLDDDIIEQLETESRTLMCLGGLVNHRFDQRRISLLLFIDSIEHSCVLVLSLHDQLRFHLFLLAFFGKSLALFLCLALLLFISTSKGTLQDFLAFKAALLDFLQFTGIVLHVRLSPATAGNTMT